MRKQFGQFKLPVIVHWIVAGSFLLLGCDSPQSEASNAVGVWREATRRIIGFDPVATGDLTSSRAMQRIYEGLLQYDYTARPYCLKPLLAEAMPTTSGDGRTYTFSLRKNIFFADDPCFPERAGREVTAHDFIYSFKRLADQRSRSSGYWTVRGRVVGLDAFREKSGEDHFDFDAPVAGLQALDRYTLRVELTEPYPQFLWLLAMHYFSVVPREAVETYGRDFAQHPVGTGPYRLKSWKRNYRVVYERNPSWHGRLPPTAPQRIQDSVVGDGTTQWLMFHSGQLERLTLSVDQADSVLLDGARLPDELEEQGIVLHRVPRLDAYYAGFNMEDPLLGGNKALRQALSCAFDAAAWARFYQFQVEPLYGPVPQPLAAGRAEPGLNGFNLERAKKRLAEAGYPGGIDPQTGRRLELTMDCKGGDSPQERQSNELFVSFMERIGVVVKVDYSNRPTFFERVRRGDVQLFRLSWIADYSDAHNFLQLFYGPNAHGSNRANYQNSNYDRLFERFSTMEPSPERLVLEGQMVDILLEDCPWIFLHQPIDCMLTQRQVENYVPHAFPGGMIKYYRLSDL